ncbi:MAG: dephospho-CoA kinase [Planctomycetia bacterium]|nr:dephospho-CoA kinase [Planctomycetia bacterium]
MTDSDNSSSPPCPAENAPFGWDTPVFGLTGGIGSGKSTVAQQLASLTRSLLVSADSLGRKALTLPHVQEAIVDRWGQSCFRRNGTLDRAKIASLVFGATPEAEQNRLFLESLTHPIISRNIDMEISRGRELGVDLILLDAPLLFEAGLDRICTAVIFVAASDRVREKRVQIRGWDPGELKNREKCQISLGEKEKKSQYVIDNNGSYERMREQVLLLFTKLMNSNKN